MRRKRLTDNRAQSHVISTPATTTDTDTTTIIRDVMTLISPGSAFTSQ